MQIDSVCYVLDWFSFNALSIVGLTSCFIFGLVGPHLSCKMDRYFNAPPVVMLSIHIFVDFSCPMILVLFQSLEALFQFL